MKYRRAIIILIYLIVSLISCVPRRKKSDTTQKLHRTGEAIATDNLIQKFESEHQKLYEEETTESDHLEWPALVNNDLSNYCRQYLQYIVPTRTIVGVIGIKMRDILHYEKESKNITNKIVIVKCKTWNISNKIIYYMTRAPEPNCVYALKSSRYCRNNLLVIVHKHCGFTDKPFIMKSLKQKRVDIIDRINCKTGQPIAKDEYLLKYELEHQEMIKIGGKEEGENNQWPSAMEYQNVNSYCHLYMRECCPGRNHKGVTGSCKIQKLRYQRLDMDKDIDVTTITCLLPYASQNRYYHTIRAPEKNCVYAVLRLGRHLHLPLAIIFKHCNFVSSPNGEITIFDKDMNPKTEVKHESLESLQLFLKD